MPLLQISCSSHSNLGPGDPPLCDQRYTESCHLSVLGNEILITVRPDTKHFRCRALHRFRESDPIWRSSVPTSNDQILLMSQLLFHIPCYPESGVDVVLHEDTLSIMDRHYEAAR